MQHKYNILSMLIDCKNHLIYEDRHIGPHKNTHIYTSVCARSDNNMFN